MMVPRPSSDLSRRRFLQAATAIGASLALARAEDLIDEGKPSSGGDDLKVALIGIGAQGRVLLDAVLKIPGVRLVAVCDIWEYARQYGERYLKKNGHPVQAYADFEDMLSKEKNLDAVIIATPDFWHAPQTNTCLKAGLHVYCEKMMSNTIDGAKSMVQTMRETGKLLQIGHQRRSNPRYLVALNRLVKEARLLGRIMAANGQWNRAVGEDLGWPKKSVIPLETLQRYGYSDMQTFRNWRWYSRYGGGPLSDLGAHQIDIFNWFFGGPPATVLGGGGNDYYPNHEWFDNAMVIFEYHTPEGAARAFYQTLTTTSGGGGYYEQFMGTEGTLKMSENPKYTSIYREARAPAWDQWVRRRYLVSAKDEATLDGGSMASEAKVDARETASLDEYKLPVVLDKAIHQPHLENFFQAIRGKAKLNCPADEAFVSEIAIFKAIEAVTAKKMITIEPKDYQI